MVRYFMGIEHPISNESFLQHDGLRNADAALVELLHREDIEMVIVRSQSHSLRRYCGLAHYPVDVTKLLSTRDFNLYLLVINVK